MSKTSQLFFDSQCRLCRTWVRLLLFVDKKKRIQFVSLQSEYSKKHLPKELHDVHTVVLQEKGKTYTKSSAILRVLIKVNLLFLPLYFFFLFPKRIRDYFYDWLAKNRYKWFGKAQIDNLIDKNNKERFILR